MVQAMPPGSVLVDLAAERGGNCELTKPGETVCVHDVSILGPLNLASDIPRHASQMYSNNITTFLQSLIQNGTPVLDMTDECIAGTLMTKGGEVVHAFVREVAGLPPLEESPAAAEPSPPPPPSREEETTARDEATAAEDEEPKETFQLSDD